MEKSPIYHIRSVRSDGDAAARHPYQAKLPSAAHPTEFHLCYRLNRMILSCTKPFRAVFEPVPVRGMFET